MRRSDAISIVEAELTRAQEAFPPFHSAHEGYSVILEEMDELWAVIKLKEVLRGSALEQEAMQVAAMAIRFLIDVC